MFRWPVLGLALMLSTPALWMAFVLGSITTTTAMIRFLIAIPVASIMLVALRTITAGYHSLSHTDKDRHHKNSTPPD